MSISMMYFEPHFNSASDGFGPEGVLREAATLSDQCMGLSGERLAAFQFLRVASRGFGLRQETSLHASGPVDEKRSSVSRTVPIRK